MDDNSLLKVYIDSRTTPTILWSHCIKKKILRDSFLNFALSKNHSKLHNRLIILADTHITWPMHMAFDMGQRFFMHSMVNEENQNLRSS